MTITQLLTAVGEEHIQVQSLQADMLASSMHKNEGKITFATDPAKVFDLCRDNAKREWMGIVVWMPRARVPKVEENDKDQQPP